MDILTAFVGELEDHLTTAPVLDIRMENIVERKTRIEFLRGFKKKSGYKEDFKQLFKSSSSSMSR